MSDPKQGGRLEDMAPTGTSIPGDAGVQRIIPSVPNPHQKEPYQTAGADLAGAADNATDIPRSTADRVGATSEVVTAYGDTMPAETETKRLQMQTGDMDNAKGSGRYEKHIRQNVDSGEALVGDGPDVEPAPGEEQLDQDTLRDRREQV